MATGRKPLPPARYVHARWPARLSAAGAADTHKQIIGLARKRAVPISDVVRECILVGLPIVVDRHRAVRFASAAAAARRRTATG